MKSFRFPLASWRDAQGNVTMRTLLDPDTTVVDVDQASALTQMENFLVNYCKDSPPPFDGDLSDLRVDRLPITVRTQYTVGGINFPSESTVTLSIPYVWGRRDSRQIFVFFPTLGIRFHCSRPSSIQSLAQYEVQQQMFRASPAEVIEALAPSEIQTDRIDVRIRPRGDQVALPQLRTINEVAIPLAERGIRNQFPYTFGHDQTIRRLTIAINSSKGNIWLVGERGAGKTTALVEAIRQLIRSFAKTKDQDDHQRWVDRAPHRYWLTSAARLISGMQYLGQWEERCERIVQELAEVQGILFVENLLDLVRTGASEPSSSVAAFLKHFLSGDHLRLVGESTVREWQTIRRLLPGFDTLFEIVHLSEMTSQDAVTALTKTAESLGSGRKMTVAANTPTLVYQLFRRFLPYAVFPGKCMNFWKRLVKQQIDCGDLDIDGDCVVRAFVDETGLPEFLIRNETHLQFEQVADTFQSRIIGQPAACEAIADLVVTFKAAMNDPRRPIGVLLFCGPTGVGKTEMAKALAEYFFGAGTGSPQRLIRLDMSEYANPGSAEKLLIKPNGSPSKLVESIRQTPFVVVLLDEIEKASHEVFDALMTVMDEGRMEDRLGRETNFQSSIIIMTSNLGAEIHEPIGFDHSKSTPHEGAVRSFFKPEFFNRLDRVIAFEHLEPNAIRRIAKKEIRELEKRDGLAIRRLSLKATPAAINEICRIGYDHRLGARPLQRAIETQIMTPLARWIAENPQQENRRLRIDFVRKQFEIDPAE